MAKFSIFHPNMKCTGSAITMELHPATDTTSGYVELSIAKQDSVSDINGNRATFDFENRICVHLWFSDINNMLQVFRGETLSIDDGHGMAHSAGKRSYNIYLQHILEPRCGYRLAVREVVKDDGTDRTHQFFITQSEALGISILFEHILSSIVFGIPTIK